MTTYLKELQANLGQHQIPQILEDLFDFDILMGDARYLEEGFSFNIDDTLELFLDANDVEEEDVEIITEKLIEFATADDTGGIFVLWLREGVKNVENAPIIWFGSEGKMKLIASNFKDFVRLLTTGRQLFIIDGPIYDYVTDLSKFKTWVKNHLDLKVIENKEDVEKITQKAITTFKEPLFNWLRKNGAEIYTLPENAVWNTKLKKW